MIAILSAVLPVAAIVLVGFCASKTLQLDLATLSRLALYVLFPALVADSLYHTTLRLENTFGLIAGSAITYFLLCLGATIVGRRMGLPGAAQKSLLATTAFPNAGNMGLSVTLFALGDAGLERGIVYMVTHSILIFITGPVFLKGGKFWESVGFVLKLPLIWGVAMGLVLHFGSLQLPLNLDRGLQILGQAAIPVALLILGMKISHNAFKLTTEEGWASLMRLFGGAGVAYIVGTVLGLTGVDFKVLVLQSSMPTAISAFLMVSEFGGDAARTARVVVVSTLFAFLTLPLVLWILKI